MSGESSKLSDERFQVWFADVEGVVMGLALYPLGRPPGWKLGIYVSTPPVLSLKEHMWTLFGIAAVVITLSIVISIMFARGLSRPLQGLALVAKKIGQFELDVDPLPRSRLTEIHETDAAVNSMIEGLRWFARYVPRQLVRRLMAQPDIDQAEMRQLTVLFTDIAGFTSMSENMSATEVGEFINHHLSLVSACIEAEGGTVDKFIGDAVMAFFGAPETQSDHASRACRAALGIRATIIADNAKRSARGLRTTRVRIGLHTGPVVVGNIGSEDRVNYTIIGDTVNVASRLESSGKKLGDPEADVGILASGEVIAAADFSDQAQEVGHYQLRGRSEETTVFRL
jgi:adenylate cyclase